MYSLCKDNIFWTVLFKDKFVSIEIYDCGFIMFPKNINYENLYKNVMRYIVIINNYKKLENSYKIDMSTLFNNI